MIELGRFRKTDTIETILVKEDKTEGRILELHSPDGVHECWLRAADNTEANVWFNALHSALAALTLKALRLASAVPDPPQLQHIGWLARRHCLQSVVGKEDLELPFLKARFAPAESVCEAVTGKPQERHRRRYSESECSASGPGNSQADSTPEPPTLNSIPISLWELNVQLF
ncbi:beta-1-syntrophin-like isoform X2, partial [Vespula maculifrons]